MPIQAFSALTGLAPKTNGKPMLVGPSTATHNITIPTIRTLGYRKTDRMVPILHAKLALLGNLWWHDEDGSGHVADVVGFTARRLWIGSANFTQRSRESLEFGYWTEEPTLMAAAERFLTQLMGSSESVHPGSDSFDPDLAEVDFDDEAMIEAMSQMYWPEND